MRKNYSEPVIRHVDYGATLERVAIALEENNKLNREWVETNTRWHEEVEAINQATRTRQEEMEQKRFDLDRAWIEWQKEQTQIQDQIASARADALEKERERAILAMFDQGMTKAELPYKGHGIPQATLDEDTATNRPQLTLGQIIAQLEAIDDKEQRYVYFDFENAYPTHLTSWRGVYAELALCFEFEQNKAPTVAEFIVRLKGAVGNVYEGYKGGSYFMSASTPVWVANWGESGSTCIVNVLTSQATRTVILETQYQDY